MLPLFEKGIGHNTISDIATVAIQSVLYTFTTQIAKNLNIKTVKYDFDGQEIDIVQNPLQIKLSPLLLIPQNILRKLPFASTRDDIMDVKSFNQTLWAKINKYISQLWTVKTKKRKRT